MRAWWACGNPHCNRYGVALAVDVGACRCCSLRVSPAEELVVRELVARDRAEWLQKRLEEAEERGCRRTQ